MIGMDLQERCRVTRRVHRADNQLSHSTKAVSVLKIRAL
jgi:hypothetical protein